VFILLFPFFHQAAKLRGEFCIVVVLSKIGSLKIFMFPFTDVPEKKIPISKKKIAAGNFFPNVQSDNTV